MGLKFQTVGLDSFLLDDVSLRQTNSDPSNPTAFRDPVVQALRTLHPGVLRFWADQLGDSLDNLIAPLYARKRAGYSAFQVKQEDISYGLAEFLELCQTLGAEPWIVVPSTFTTTEAAGLIEYLAGAQSSPYGARRAASGHPTPWASMFHKIYLEFGNEAWNAVFKGGSIEYPIPYASRAQEIFASMRAHTAYDSSVFDLVLGGQAAWPGRNLEIQNNCNNNDSFALAPYMMSDVDSFASDEDLFGSTFAEAEAYVTPTGIAEGVNGGMMYLNQQAIASSKHPVPIVGYEMNLNTLSGSITQEVLNRYVSSLAAGLAVVDSMLQQMRMGIGAQNLFALPQSRFRRPDGKTIPLWGSVIDMGVTNRRRPQYLALQLANEAIGDQASMLQTAHRGLNPTWNQPLVNTVQLEGAHYLQSFAFASGNQRSLIVLNLHRNASLPVMFGGTNAPEGEVQLSQLTSALPTDTNEDEAVVNIQRKTLSGVDAATKLSLPPYSMTVLRWNTESRP